MLGLCTKQVLQRKLGQSTVKVRVTGQKQSKIIEKC